jgi:hypothetical protein
MAQHQVLFCPFCRESFEGHTRCPEHDLDLVSFDRLPPDPNALETEEDDDDLQGSSRAHDEARVLAAFDPHYGRGLVAAGALLNAMTLGVELLKGVGESEGLRTHEVAITAPSLWTLPMVSFTLLYILHQRRSPLRLRSLRVLVPLLSLVSPATLLWVFFRIRHGASVWATGGRTIGVEPGQAVYVVALASVLIFWGGVRLGARRSASRR